MAAQVEALPLSSLRPNTREFDKFDINKDGRLDGREVLRMPTESTIHLFDKAYSNGGESRLAALTLFGKLPEKTTDSVLQAIKSRYSMMATAPTDIGLRLMQMFNDFLWALPEARCEKAYRKFADVQNHFLPRRPPGVTPVR